MTTRLRWILIASITGVVILSIGGIWYLRTRSIDQPGYIPGGQPLAAPSSAVPAASQPTSKETSIPPSEPQIPVTLEPGMPDPSVDWEAYRKAVEEPTTAPAGPPQQPTTPPSPVASVDADSDGLTTEQEAALGTDPNNADTDGDGLTDRQEAETYKTDPLKADTDGDTFPDGSEVKAGYNPLGPGKCARVSCIP